MSDCGTTWIDETLSNTPWTDPSCVPLPDELIFWTFTDGTTIWTFTNETPWTFL